MQAKGAGKRLSCDECMEEHEAAEEEPPCDECGRPTLLACNRRAYRVWQICHVHGRQPSFGGLGPILASEAVTVAAELEDATREDVLKALMFDREFLAAYREHEGDK